MQAKLAIVGFFIITLIGGFLYDYFSTPEKLTPYVKQITEYQDFPEVNFIQFNGESLNVHNLNEQVVLINFWASWCSTCVIEMPDMINLVQKMNGKVALITVSIDETQQLAENFQQKFPESSHVYWAWDKDKNISLNKFNILKTPETIILNKNRKMVNKIVGEYNWASDDAMEMLNKL